MSEILEITPKTTKIPRRIKHADAALYWRECNMNVAATARHFSVERNTVAQWMEDERWQDWVQDTATEQARQYEAANVTLFNRAVTVADLMMSNALAMAARLGDALDANHSVDEMDVGAVNQTVNAAIANADKLFGWSKLKIEHSGEVAYRDATAQQARLAERLREFEEARA